MALMKVFVTLVIFVQFVATWPYHGCGCYDACDPCKKKEPPKPEGYIHGSCSIRPNPSNPDLSQRLSGTVHFRQKASGGETMFKIDISGFDTSDADVFHGFHVHTYGAVENACEDAAGHFNPAGVTHGGPNDAIRHVGDLGNIKEDGSGNVMKDGVDSMISLSGANNIIGRSIVVHANKDDLGRGGDEGSLATGNAGARLACCTIALTDDTAWG